MSRTQQLHTIKTSILLSLAYRNMWSKKLRTSLTITGVVIGIGSIVFLLSIGLGLQNLVTNQLVGSKSVKSIDVTTPKSEVIKLDDAASGRFEQMSGVDQVSKIYSLAGKISFRGSTSDAVVYGIDQNYFEFSSFKFLAGHAVSMRDESSMVLNSSVLKTIGFDDPQKAIGQTITIKVTVGSVKTGYKQLEHAMHVDGVVDTGSGSEIYVPSTLLKNAGATEYTQVKLLATSTDAVAVVRKGIESQGFLTSSPADTLDQVNQLFRLFNIILAGFGGIGMVIAILGMFNTLTISLLERTQEIGLMMALGARRADIRRVFIAEALMLSLLGGALGIILAGTLGLAINIGLNMFAHNRGVAESFSVVAMPWWLILGGLLFTAIVGFLVVLLPSRRASKINPIDALRRE